MCWSGPPLHAAALFMSVVFFYFNREDHDKCKNQFHVAQS
jgi:hypothetical protein